MSHLSKIRAGLGFTQLQMAQWLGISRTLYSMAESGHRLLPTAASTKLGTLEVKKNKEGAGMRLPGAYKKWEAAFCKNLEGDLRYKKLLRQRQLRAMERRYKACVARLQTAQLVEATETAGATAYLWARVTGADAQKQLKDCNTLCQQLLQIEIDALEKMLAAVSAAGHE